MIRHYLPLDGARVLDVGCGLGLYVRRMSACSADVHGVDVDPEKVAAASEALPNIRVAPAESLPYPDATFDGVLLHEVLEHVSDDRLAVREAWRVLRPGGRMVIFAPNRWYPFETHGIYWGRRYIFGNIPFVNWLPDTLRNRLVPHARAYLHGDWRDLIAGTPLRIVDHTYVYPGFDNIAARSATLARILRAVCYRAEHSPLRRLGLSHLVVLRRDETLAEREAQAVAGEAASGGAS